MSVTGSILTSVLIFFFPPPFSHIFYRLLEGLSESEKKDICLRDAAHYYYLAQSQCFEIEDVDETTQFQRTMGECVRVCVCAYACVYACVRACVRCVRLSLRAICLCVCDCVVSNYSVVVIWLFIFACRW